MVALPGARIANNNYKIKRKIRGWSLGMSVHLVSQGFLTPLYQKKLQMACVLPETAVPGEVSPISWMKWNPSGFLSLKPCRYSFDAWIALWNVAIYDKAVNFKTFTLTETDQAAADALSVSIDWTKAPYCSSFWIMWPLHQVHSGCRTSSRMKCPSHPNSSRRDQLYPALLWSAMRTLTWIPLKEMISVCVKRVQVKLVTLDGKA